MPKGTGRIGFYSRRSAIERLDGRRAEAKLMRTVIAGLEGELGGPDKVTFRQSILIRACADLTLRLQLASGRYVRDPDDDRAVDLHVCGLVNSLSRAFRALDGEVVRDIGPTLAEYLAAKPAVRVDDAP